MSIRTCFPTSIYYEPLAKSGLQPFNKELLEECYQLRDYDRAGRRWSAKHYLGGYTSYASMNNLHKFSSTFTQLEESISRHVKRFANHLDFDIRGQKLVMTDCWVNIMPVQVAHGLHLHPLSVISGTYYVKTPRGCSSIKFEDPRLSKFMGSPPRRANCAPQNQQHVSYVAKAGHVVLFESWLRHEVPANPTKEERVSISFNYALG